MINIVMEINTQVADESTAEEIITEIRKLFKSYEKIGKSKVPMIELIVRES